MIKLQKAIKFNNTESLPDDTYIIKTGDILSYSAAINTF